MRFRVGNDPPGNCCSLPPLANPPRSIVANPTFSRMPLTSALAAASSPDMNNTRCASGLIRISGQNGAQQGVGGLNDASTGASDATVSLDVLPFRSAMRKSGSISMLLGSHKRIRVAPCGEWHVRVSFRPPRQDSGDFCHDRVLALRVTRLGSRKADRAQLVHARTWRGLLEALGRRLVDGGERH